MPSPRFQHGYAHDVFFSYTHTDDQLDAGRHWVTQFQEDLQARLSIVSGHTVEIWRDQEKLGAADRFNDSIAAAVRSSAVLLVVLSPSYFQSEYCGKERMEFYQRAREEGKESVGTKARVVKVAKFRVGLEEYPPDLRDLLEHRFFVEMLGSSACREFHVSDDPLVRERYHTKVDDVAQEVAGLLAGLEPAAAPSQPKGQIYLAETTSDLESHRDDLRRHLIQLGYDVQPRAELRLLPPPQVRVFVEGAIHQSLLSIHPVGAYYGAAPEGADGKSFVELQLELARTDARNGDLPRIIWVPEGLVPVEAHQKALLDRVRTEFAGRGFEFLERPYRALTARIEDRLKPSGRNASSQEAGPSGIYLICDGGDRVLAKGIRAFLFNQQWPVEWTPVSLDKTDLSGNPEHLKLLRRNGVHLVLHGETGDAWLQDRIRELNEMSPQGARRAIYLANPRREDKNDILVRNIALLEGYAPRTVADALAPYFGQMFGPKPAGPGGGPPLAEREIP